MNRLPNRLALVDNYGCNFGHTQSDKTLDDVVTPYFHLTRGWRQACYTPTAFISIRDEHVTLLIREQTGVQVPRWVKWDGWHRPHVKFLSDEEASRSMRRGWTMAVYLKECRMPSPLLDLSFSLSSDRDV